MTKGLTLEYTGVSYKGSRLKYADLYMHIEMLKFERSEFDRTSKIVRAGWECPRADLLDWRPQPSSAVRRSDLAGILAGYKGDAADTVDSLLADA